MRKRSKYRPKGVLIDPINHVLSGLKRVGSVSHGTTLMIRNHEALESVRKGEGNKQDVNTLIDALNITEALAVLNFGQDWRVEIRAAQDALFALGSRGAQTGKFILRGPELIALNLGMEIHDAQLEACTISDLEKAIDIVAKRQAHGQVRYIVRKEKGDEKAKETE